MSSGAKTILKQLSTRYPSLLLKQSLLNDGALPTQTVDQCLSHIAKHFCECVDTKQLKPLPNSNALRVANLDHAFVAQVTAYRDVSQPLQKQYDDNPDEDLDESQVSE